MPELTHFAPDGAPRMVDVGGKAATEREARATALVRLQPATLALIVDRKFAKGDVLQVARLAGIMATKRTADLIPLCHPLPLTGVDVDLVPEGDAALRVSAAVRVFGRTGVEMEALTAVSIAALTVYDMVKAVDRGVVIDAVRLESKSGGASGDFRRADGPPGPS